MWPEVPKRRQPNAGISRHLEDGARIERGCCAHIGAILDREPHHAPAGDCEQRRHPHQLTPGHGVRAPREQVRKRRADGERSDHDAERCASAVEEPSGSDFQAGRIHAGEREAGQCPERDDCRWGRSKRDDGICGGSNDAPEGEQSPGIEHVGQIQQAAQSGCPRRTPPARPSSTTR